MKKEAHATLVFVYLMWILGKGHSVYANKFYTNNSLVTYSKIFYYIGTANVNRKTFLPTSNSEE